MNTAQLSYTGRTGTTMTLTECKEFLRRYQAVSESGNVQFNWRTTARWSLRHRWAQEENGKLRDALRYATERAGEVDACHDIMAECRRLAGDPHTSTVDAVRGLLARAEAAEAKLAQCQAWRQEEANNLNHCIRAKQKLLDDRSKLRRALAQLVGADTIEELQNMEAIMRVAPAPAKDKAAAIDAIHALIEVPA